MNTFQLIDDLITNEFFDTRESIIRDILMATKMNKSAITINKVMIFSDATIKYSTIWSTGITYHTIAVQDLLGLVEKYLEIKKQNYAADMHQFMIDNRAAYGKSFK
jgi:hypothetical protein